MGIWGGSAGLSGELLENCLSGLAGSEVFLGKMDGFTITWVGGTVGHSFVFPEEKQFNERQAALVSWQALSYNLVDEACHPIIIIII